jgi:hypothetical protein
MKKLLGIVALGLLLSSNAYANIIILNCKNLMKEVAEGTEYSTMRIDFKSKTIDTGHGKQLLSKIVEVDDAYLKASYMGFDTDTLYIDRYTGIAKVISIYKVEGQKKIEIIESYKCEKVKKLF